MSKIKLPEFMLADLNIYITSPSTAIVMNVKISNAHTIDLDFVPDISAITADPSFSKLATDWRLMDHKEIKEYLLANMDESDEVRVHEEDDDNGGYSPL